jgi:hypothetical protein
MLFDLLSGFSLYLTVHLYAFSVLAAMLNIMYCLRLETCMQRLVAMVLFHCSNQKWNLENSRETMKIMHRFVSERTCKKRCTMCVNL